MAALGPAGSFSHAAALTLLSTGANAAGPSFTSLSALATISSCFSAVRDGQCGAALVPIENLVQGPVTETLDLLFEHSEWAQITGGSMLEVVHCIGSPEGVGLAELTEVLSHPQALAQCSAFLERECPQAARTSSSSTAAAARDAAARPREQRVGAIGQERALREAGLQVLATNVGNVPDNRTRFVLVTPRAAGPPPPRTGRDVTLFVVHPPRDRKGILLTLISLVSEGHSLNMSSIHSRPDLEGGFRFFLTVEGHLEDRPVAECLAEAARRFGGDGILVRVLGSHPRLEFTRRRIHTVGIVGGAGRMGRWFARFLGSDCGLRVLSSESEGYRGEVPVVPLEELVEKSDVVLISVPINAVEGVARRVAPMCRPGQLLVDNTSVKSQPVAVMLECAPSGVEVLGMHTIFGPAVPSPNGQNIVFCSGAAAEPGGREPAAGTLASEWIGLYYKFGAHIEHTTPAQHDRQMALHQGMEHFSKLALAKVVADSFSGELESLGHYASPNSRASLATMGRVLTADTSLLVQIQQVNAEGLAVLQQYAKGVNDLLAQVMALRQNPGDPELATTINTIKQTLGPTFLQGLNEQTKH